MAMGVSVPRYTVADLERFPNDGNRYELLDGVLLVTPAPSYAHQIIVNRLQFRLTQAVVVPGDGQVVGPGAITVLPGTQLEPDILVHPARFPVDSKWENIDEHWLAVEVVSRSSRVYDREIKRDAYMALGVREVWLVDRWRKVVEVSRTRGPGAIVDKVLRWRVPTLASEVEISLTEIFAGL
jgi:Uma2 family endonuclease